MHLSAEHGKAVADFFIKLNETVETMKSAGRIRDVSEKASVVEAYLRGFNEGHDVGKKQAACALRELADGIGTSDDLGRARRALLRFAKALEAA